MSLMDDIRRRAASERTLGRIGHAQHLEAVIAINEELARAGINAEFTPDEIGITEKSVFERPIGSTRRLSDLVINHSFPTISQTTASHYTTSAAFTKILESRRIHLCSVHKRIKEDELRSFLETFGITAAMVTDPANGKPVYEELAKSLFYISLCEDQNSDHLWTCFADDRRGVRLDFEIKAHVEDFRRISYSAMENSIAKRLLSRLSCELGRLFLLRGLARIIAFHLPVGYERENETRLLLSQKSDTYSFPYEVRNHASGYSYIELPIFGESSKHYSINLAGIAPGARCDVTLFDSQLDRFGLRHLKR